MENEKLDERALWRIIDSVSKEYITSKGYGKSREVMFTGGRDKDCSSSSSSSSGDEEKKEDEGDTTEGSIDDAYNKALDAVKALSATFREECFLPCYTSNAEVMALMFLSDALAVSNDVDRVAPLLSAVYRSHYKVALPQDVQGGITDYVKQVKAGDLPQPDWFAHASAFVSMYQESVWKREARRHEELWNSALHSSESPQWSAFFHTMHALNAAPTAKIATRFVKHLSAGGFSNRTAIVNLHQSLEEERSQDASAQRLLSAAQSILKQASIAVDSVDGEDLLALYLV